jgi:hypothetical protein
MIWGYWTHQVDVEQVTETETKLSIDFRTPRHRVTGLISTIFFVLIPSLIVFLAIQYFGLMENILVRILVIVAGLVVFLILGALLARLHNYYVCPQASMEFDRQSGMMTVRLGRLGKREEMKTLPIANIRAIVFVRLRTDPHCAQLLLERTDGNIISIELDAFAPITASKDQNQVEEYERVAQRIHRFLNLPASVRSVIQNDVWRGQSELAVDPPASEPGFRG